MKRIVFSFILAVICFELSAQTFEVPRNYKLEKAEDYAPYEQDMIGCINWLSETPLNEQAAKRKEANAFLLKWLSGSPEIKIEIKPEIVTFMGSSPDLLLIFMGGWAKYSIENKDPKNKVAGSLAGIEAVVDFHFKNRQLLPKDKNVDKYAKMREKGTLREYVMKNA